MRPHMILEEPSVPPDKMPAVSHPDSFPVDAWGALAVMVADDLHAELRRDRWLAQDVVAAVLITSDGEMRTWTVGDLFRFDPDAERSRSPEMLRQRIGTGLRLMQRPTSNRRKGGKRHGGWSAGPLEHPVAVAGMLRTLAPLCWTEPIEELEFGLGTLAALRFHLPISKVIAPLLGPDAEPWPLSRDFFDVNRLLRSRGGESTALNARPHDLDSLRQNCRLVMEALVDLDRWWTEESGVDDRPMDRFVSWGTASASIMSDVIRSVHVPGDAHDAYSQAHLGGYAGAVGPDAIHTILRNDEGGGWLCVDLASAYPRAASRLRIADWEDFEHVTDPVQLEGLLLGEGLMDHRAGACLRVRGPASGVPVRVGPEDEHVAIALADVDSDVEWWMMWLDWLRADTRPEVLEAWVPVIGKPSHDPFLDMMRMRDERDPVWWRGVANSSYGVLARRTGVDRKFGGRTMRVPLAAAITAWVRHHAMRMMTECDGIYTDTDSAIIPAHMWDRAAKIASQGGFDLHDKTEFGGVASMVMIGGAKRYALVGADGEFVGRCHGLGMWWTVDDDGEAVPIAWDADALRAVWAYGYPTAIGEPDPHQLKRPVFQRYVIRTAPFQAEVETALRGQGMTPCEAMDHARIGTVGHRVNIEDGDQNIHVPSAAEAARLAELTLEDVASWWTSNRDLKFDYGRGRRWRFDDADIVHDGKPYTRDEQAHDPSLEDVDA